MSPNDYFKERSEVVALVPKSARCVVDVGCGPGLIGAALKRERPELRVFGIEPSQEAAAQARKVLDDVFVGTAEALDRGRWPAPDCVIFADALEHMIDPWSVLRHFHALLQPGGSLVISLPNMLHHSASFGLLSGAWNYTDQGILDRSHLRFFTRQTAVELVEGSGFEVVELLRKLHYPRNPFVKFGLKLLSGPRRMHEARAKVGSRGFSFLDIATFQYLIVAEKRST